MPQFQRYEIPVAFGMLDLIDQPQPAPRFPFSNFCCCWMAFNNIYFTIGQRAVRQAVANGAAVPIDSMSERKQINAAKREFTPALKHTLINNDHFDFFATRRPRWQNQELIRDGNGEPANGVVNLGFSSVVGMPVLTKIDRLVYERWKRGPQHDHDRNRLARQIVAVIYTVRNNTFHGGKEWDDVNAQNVVNNAYPLLRMIVDSFLLR